MEFALSSIPVTIARLIIGFTQNKLSEGEMHDLDRWIEESDENWITFEALTDGMDDNVFSADELIIETDDLLDCWMIARQMQGILGQDEKKALDQWREASPRNEELYRLFSDKANLQKFVTWLKKLNRDSSTGLN